MDSKWFLDLGWSIFRHSCRTLCDPEAEAAFRKRYEPVAKEVSQADPVTVGEALVWLARAGEMAGQKAMRGSGILSAGDVVAAADAVKLISDTTWC